MVTSGGNTAQMWESATGKPIGEPLRHEDAVSSANFSPDGTRVVTASNDKTARVWDAATGKPIGEPLCHEDEVNSASFSPDGTRVVTASGEFGEPGHAQVWDAATGKPIGEPLRHESDVNSASFSPDGTRVVTASWDSTARVWDAATGKRIGAPLRHEDEVNSASFSPDGSRVVTVSRDETARVWDAATGKPIGEPLRHEWNVNSASFSPDGTRVVTVSDDNTARVWDVATGRPAITDSVLNWAQAIAGLRYASDGELEEIPHDERMSLLLRAKDTPPPEWKNVADWVLDTPMEQPFHVKSRHTLRQLAERERDFNGVGTVESLTSALEYDYSLPLTRLLLANPLENGNAAKKAAEQDATIPARAAHLRRYDLDRLPDDPVLWTRAAKALNDAPAGAMVGIGPKAVSAKAAAIPTAEKALALKPNDPAAQAELERAKKSLNP